VESLCSLPEPGAPKLGPAKPASGRGVVPKPGARAMPVSEFLDKVVGGAALPRSRGVRNCSVYLYFEGSRVLAWFQILEPRSGSKFVGSQRPSRGGYEHGALPLSCSNELTRRRNDLWRACCVELLWKSEAEMVLRQQYD